MEQIFPTWVSPDAERVYGTVLRHAERTCCRWIPGALKCFKGAGEPHRTPALMAGIDAVPCASASRRPPGSLLAWNNFFPTWVSLTPSGHTVRSCGTCPGRPCGTCPGRSCGTCPGRSCGTCPGRSCGTCPGRSCGTCPGRSCGTCPGRRPAARQAEFLCSTAPVIRHTGPATSCGASPPAEAVLRLGLRPTGGDPYARSLCWNRCCSLRVSAPARRGENSNANYRNQIRILRNKSRQPTVSWAGIETSSMFFEGCAPRSVIRRRILTLSILLRSMS